MLISKRKLLGTLFALTIVSIFVATSSQSLADPVPGGPGFISIGALDFRPNSNGVSNSYTNNRLYNNTSSLTGFHTPVHLPHGAIITQVVLYFVANGFNSITLYMVSYPLNEPSAVTQMVYMSTSGASPDPRTMIFNTFYNGNTIDNQSNSYIVSVGLPPGTNFSVGGVRIDYNYPIALPLIMK
jgi:hypothetical protein